MGDRMTRQQFTIELKAAILRRHLHDEVSVVTHGKTSNRAERT